MPFEAHLTDICFLKRKEGDSNPRYPTRVRQFSKLVVSATHPSFLTEFSVKEWCKGMQKKQLSKISVIKIFTNIEKCPFCSSKMPELASKYKKYAPMVEDIGLCMR